MRWARTLWPIYLLLVFSGWAALVVRSAKLQLGHVSSDWLLDYRFGFIRRGFSGELIWFLHDSFGVAVVHAVAIAQVSAFGVLLYALWRLTRSSGVPLSAWFLAYSPATLLFSLFGWTEPGRKEVLLFALFALVAVCLRRWRAHIPKNALRVCMSTSIIGVLAALVILSHELAFFYMPWLVWLVWLGLSDLQPARRFLGLGLMMIWPMMVFALLIFLGGPLERHSFCNSFVSAGLSASMCQGVLSFPIDDLIGSFRNTGSIVEQFGYFQTYGLGLVCLLVPLFVAARVEGVRVTRSVVVGVAVSALWSLPLFAVAVDWGRFIQIHLVLGLTLWLFALSFGSDPATHVAAPASRSIARSWGVMLIAAVFSLMFWNLPVCCERGVGAGVVGHVLAIIGR